MSDPWGYAPAYGSWSKHSFAPRQAVDIFGGNQWRRAVESLDWNRIYIEAQGCHLRHTGELTGTTCGTCIKEVLLDTYDGVTQDVGLSLPPMPSEEADEPTPAQQERVEDDPSAGQNDLNPALARTEPVHP